MAIATAEPLVKARPRILYVPVSPGSPEPEHMDHFLAGIRGGSVDVVVVETYMSGGIPSEEPHSMVPFILDAAREVPTFLVPQGKHPQTHRLREDIFYSLELYPRGAFPLDAAFSAQADQIGQDITRLWTQGPEKLIAEMKAKYQQPKTP